MRDDFSHQLLEYLYLGVREGDFCEFGNGLFAITGVVGVADGPGA
jgi:hypothetical protein